MALTPEAQRQLQFLARCPSGHTTVEEKDLKQILLDTGGNMLACGRLYNIKSNHLGVGIHRIYLELANP